MTRMKGIRQMRRALKRLPDDLKDQVRKEMQITLDGVHARGRANIAAMIPKAGNDVRTGNLKRLYRKSKVGKALKGRVGYLSRASFRKAWYARFVNDGTVKMTARPFHTNAVEAEKERDTRRMVLARNKAVTLALRREGRVT